MDRRGFLSKLTGLAAAAVVAPQAVKALLTAPVEPPFVMHPIWLDGYYGDSSDLIWHYVADTDVLLHGDFGRHQYVIRRAWPAGNSVSKNA